jgi:hypothetical protein
MFQESQRLVLPTLLVLTCTCGDCIITINILVAVAIFSFELHQPFTAASLIFNIANSCAADAFESIGVLRGLVEAIRLAEKHAEVLEDFCNFVHNELLIHAASPLSIRQIVCDAAEYAELNYAAAITSDENSFLDRFTLFQRIKKNTDKTLLRILGQPPYFHVPTV